MSDGLFLGNRLIRLKKVESTNDYLKTLVSETKNQLEGLVVIADAQTKGRGQQGTKWLSEPGMNLCFSIYLKPKLDLSKQFVISQITSLALVDFIKSNGIEEVSIKWPNDIYINNEKVAGMLIENLVKDKRIEHSIIGIGLNVNQLKFDASLTNPTSLSLQLNEQQLDLQKLLVQFLSLLEKYYRMVRVDYKYELIHQEYDQKLYQKNQSCDYLIDGSRVEGSIKGINQYGQLIVQVNNELKTVDLKEIQFL